MFKILAPGNRRRRVWSPTTIAVSVAFHGLFFLGVARASMADSPAKGPEEEPIWIPVPQAPPPPPPAPVRPAPPAPRDEPRQPPKTGDFKALRPPADVPDQIPVPDPTQRVEDPKDYRGQGEEGDKVGPVVPGDDRPLTGDTAEVEPRGDGDVLDARAVEELPEVRNRREMVNLLERTYPGTLRDAGVEGRVVVQFVVDTEGRVEPESIRIVSSTHAAFEAPSRRAAERMRFRPARVNGQPVRVMISLPVDWKVPD